MSQMDKFRGVYNKHNDDGHEDLEYNSRITDTQTVLDESKQEKNPYKTLVSGREFIVLPNVFSPKYFKDTEAFAEHLPVKEGEDMLEIGPGTGAVSITALYKGARRVVAIDINHAAVQNTLANIELHGMHKRMEVRQGSVYSALQKEEQFDSIFWNTPFGLVESLEVPDLEKAVFDPGYRATETFIKEAPLHLKPGGRLLIGFSTTLGRLDLIEKFCQQAHMELRLLYEEESKEVRPVKFEIFEATLKE